MVEEGGRGERWVVKVKEERRWCEAEGGRRRRRWDGQGGGRGEGGASGAVGEKSVVGVGVVHKVVPRGDGMGLDGGEVN